MSALTASLPTDPAAAARKAGLRYVSDSAPGIRRIARGRGFAYLGPGGRSVRDPDTLERIRKLAIPPAWTQVWISPHESGHIQATGRDDRGRKQYRYHPDWQEVRTATKFHRMRAFGRMLPKIRRTVRRHLALPGMRREKVLAAVVDLMQATHIRVGNDEYVRQNQSYGLTTLQDHHVDVAGSHIRFSFQGKSGKEHEVCIEDPRLARIVRQCQDLPGQELFQYVDDDGQVRDVGSDDVNAYLREITGEDFTAKDFRTWAGTVLFVEAARRIEPCRTKTQTRKTLVELVRQVAEELGNTPTVCRKYYIHPFTIESFLENSLHETLEAICRLDRGAGSLSAEALVMKMLDHLARRAPAAKGSTPRRARRTA